MNNNLTRLAIAALGTALVAIGARTLIVIYLVVSVFPLQGTNDFIQFGMFTVFSIAIVFLGVLMIQETIRKRPIMKPAPKPAEKVRA